jgi:hypothetical protein
MRVSSAALSPSTVSVGGAVLIEIRVEDVASYFFTSKKYALKTADGGYFIAKESED